VLHGRYHFCVRISFI